MASMLTDQASGLRRLFGNRVPQVIAFAASPDAAGKAALLARTAVALAADGHAVAILDENPGPHNVATHLEVTPRRDLADVVNGHFQLSQIAMELTPGIRVLPAHRLAAELSPTDGEGMDALFDCLRVLQSHCAFILIDCANRRGGQLSALAQAARHMAVLVGTSAAELTRSYALIKRIAQERGREDFHVAVDKARTAIEAQTAFSTMRQVAQDHLGVELSYLGSVSETTSGSLAEALLSRLPAGEETALPGGRSGLRNSAPGRMALFDSMV